MQRCTQVSIGSFSIALSPLLTRSYCMSFGQNIRDDSHYVCESRTSTLPCITLCRFKYSDRCHVHKLNVYLTVSCSCLLPSDSCVVAHSGPSLCGWLFLGLTFASATPSIAPACICWQAPDPPYHLPPIQKSRIFNHLYRKYTVLSMRVLRCLRFIDLMPPDVRGGLE